MTLEHAAAQLLKELGNPDWLHTIGIVDSEKEKKLIIYTGRVAIRRTFIPITEFEGYPVEYRYTGKFKPAEST